MAILTDRLETLLRLVGSAEYAQGMQQAAHSTDAMTRAQKEQETRGKTLKNALGDLGVEHAILAGRLTAAAFLVKESIANFREDEDAIFRTTVVLRNLGNSYPIEQALAFANTQERLTGMGADQILVVEGLLKRFGAADDQIQNLTKTVLDFSAATGLSLEHASTAVGHALVGNARILKNMGVEFKTTGDRAQDLVTVQEKLNRLFGGAAGARLDTLTGQFNALKQAIGGFFSTVGDKLSTVLVPALKAVTALINFIANNAAVATTIVGAAIGAFVGGPIGALVGGVAGLGLGLLPSRANPAAQIGTGRMELATEGTQKEIARNTKATADALVRQVLGGTLPGGTLNIRGLNAALRAAR